MIPSVGEEVLRTFLKIVICYLLRETKVKILTLLSEYLLQRTILCAWKLDMTGAPEFGIVILCDNKL